MDAEEKLADLEARKGKLPMPHFTNYWDFVRPTYIENWPAALTSLSIAQVGMKLNRDQVWRLGRNMMEFAECFYEGGRQEMEREGGPPAIDDIRSELVTIVDRMPQRGNETRVFARLGSRSPKDAMSTRAVCFNADMVLARLLDGSGRMYEDLALALSRGYDPYIWVRQWVDIEPWSEFRCFQRDRKLVGISEYERFQGPYPELHEDHQSIEHVIRLFWEEQFLPACHLDDVVFDVFVKKRSFGTRDGIPGVKKASYEQRVWEVKLIEINPFFEFTDPCMFDWRDGGDFDGSFRWRPVE